MLSLASEKWANFVLLYMRAYGSLIQWSEQRNGIGAFDLECRHTHYMQYSKAFTRSTRKYIPFEKTYFDFLTYEKLIHYLWENKWQKWTESSNGGNKMVASSVSTDSWNIQCSLISIIKNVLFIPVKSQKWSSFLPRVRDPDVFMYACIMWMFAFCLRCHCQLGCRDNPFSAHDIISSAPAALPQHRHTYTAFRIEITYYMLSQSNRHRPNHATPPSIPPRNTKT